MARMDRPLGGYSGFGGMPGAPGAPPAGNALPPPSRFLGGFAQPNLSQGGGFSTQGGFGFGNPQGGPQAGRYLGGFGRFGGLPGPITVQGSPDPFGQNRPDRYLGGFGRPVGY